MEKSEFSKKIQDKIAACEKKYDKARKDAYLSTVYSSELETWRFFLERLENDSGQEDAAVLQSDLKKRLCELEAEKEREEHCPSFSWYGEHYNYLVLEGQCDAYRGMLEFLENMETGQIFQRQEESGQSASDL